VSYYRELGLDREPFSTSPDPAFFFLSEEHKAALYRLQVAISLKRGLCVLLGDVGTGKTTLGRKLSQALAADEQVVLRMILNPYFATEKQFLSRMANLFHVKVSSRATALQIMEAIERFLFRCGVEEGKTVVLLIDEAQILPDFVFETLRILLNYETNEFKMLQLILSGQMELLPRISSKNNFWDRISLKCILNPLKESEIKKMLEFRLRQAGYTGSTPLFTDEAISQITIHTQGYPRKLAFFCHSCLESLVMYDRRVVTVDLVKKLIEAEVRQVEEVAAADPEPASPAQAVPAQEPVHERQTPDMTPVSSAVHADDIDEQLAAAMAAIASVGGAEAPKKTRLERWMEFVGIPG